MFELYDTKREADYEQLPTDVFRQSPSGTERV